MKTIFSLAALTVLTAGALTAPAQASCYGQGYSRYCTGYGGGGATYSDRGSDGRTTYYNQDGSTSRTETYRSTPGYGNSYSNTYRY